MALKRLNLKSLWCFLLEKSRLQSMPSSEALQTRCTVNQSKEFGIRLDDHDKNSLCMIMMCLPFQLGDLALRVCEGLQGGVSLGQLSPQPRLRPPGVLLIQSFFSGGSWLVQQPSFLVIWRMSHVNGLIATYNHQVWLSCSLSCPVDVCLTKSDPSDALPRAWHVKRFKQHLKQGVLCSTFEESLQGVNSLLYFRNTPCHTLAWSF